MHNRFWLTSDSAQRRLSAVRTTSSRRKALRQSVQWICVVLLMAAVLHLSACTTLPPAPCEPPVLPRPPALSEPLPSVSYSEQWRQLAETWRKKLTDTPTTSAP